MDLSQPSAAQVAQRVVAGWRGLRWWWRGVIGEDAYERYLDYHARAQPETTPMTEREFWRDRTDQLERNPRSRCC